MNDLTANIRVSCDQHGDPELSGTESVLPYITRIEMVQRLAWPLCKGHARNRETLIVLYHHELIVRVPDYNHEIPNSFPGPA